MCIIRSRDQVAEIGRYAFGYSCWITHCFGFSRLDVLELVLPAVTMPSAGSGRLLQNLINQPVVGFHNNVYEVAGWGGGTKLWFSTCRGFTWSVQCPQEVYTGSQVSVVSKSIYVIKTEQLTSYAVTQVSMVTHRFSVLCFFFCSQL